MKYILSLLVLLLFQGCILVNSTINTTNTTVNKTKYKSAKAQETTRALPIKKDSSSLYNIEIQTVKKTQKINLLRAVYTGSIKGLIESVVYSKTKKAWLYKIVGKDTSNGKLPYAEFYHDKKLAHIGDLVYVILDNSKLKNLFFIEKANRMVKKSKKIKRLKKPSKVYKQSRGRKRPKISVPTVENVNF